MHFVFFRLLWSHRKLIRVQPLCSSKRCERARASLARGLTTQVLKDIRIRQLICVPCYRPEEVAARVITTALLGLNCSCFAFAISGPALAIIHQLHFLAAPRTCPFGLPSGRWTQVCFFHFPPAICSPPFSKVAFFPDIAL